MGFLERVYTTERGIYLKWVIYDTLVVLLLVQVNLDSITVHKSNIHDVIGYTFGETETTASKHKV